MRRVLLATAALATLASCAPNPWRQAFVPSPSATDAGLLDESQAPANPPEPDLITADHEDLDAYDAAARDARTRLGPNPAAWPAPDRIALSRLFLDALFADENPAATAVLGVARFTNTSPTGGEPGSLADAAIDLNADVAIATSAYLGLRPTIVNETVTSDIRLREYYASADRDDPRYLTGTETTSVPVVIDKPTYLHTAWFLRRVDPANPAAAVPPPPDAFVVWSR